MRSPLQWSWLLAFCCVAANREPEVSENQVGDSTAMAAKTVFSDIPPETEFCAGMIPARSNPPRDCAELAACGQTKSGVFQVFPEGGSTYGTKVYCDLEADGGGWTVIQRRGQFGNPKDYFYRRWRDYKFGFGNLQKEFWIGNDNLHYLTNQKNYVLRVTLKDHLNETRYARYDEFYVENETRNYRLWINLYSGDAGDSMVKHNGWGFSTLDKNHARRSCATEFKGAWWYENCHEANLNGLNHNGPYQSYADGLSWYQWKGHHYSYPQTEMKIRPKVFL